VTKADDIRSAGKSDYDLPAVRLIVRRGGQRLSVGDRAGDCEERAVSCAEIGLRSSQKAIPSTITEGLGTALALPLLDSMVPALSAWDALCGRR
jgi:hypothetical protein